ncbi:MAG: methyltransferase domain-containing protein [Solirubrobacteraceae bacterium]
MNLAEIRDRLAQLTPAARATRRVRRDLAERHLSGAGLEIGALHCPLQIPAAASVRYVDRMDLAGLRGHYPELESKALVEVDVIDDGETLAAQPDASVDFVIANHFIEHTQDPIGTIGNHLRVLRPGGIVYMAVPDREQTFDVLRAPTLFEHVLRDHREGPGWSRMPHFEEWARFVDRVPEAEVAGRARELSEMDYSIHFHVWTPDEFAAMLTGARREAGLDFDVAEQQVNGIECVFILRRA